MYVTNLSLRDFRNYQRLDLSINPGITLLYGPNASGKTSLLESLFYIATTRSPRTNADRELVRWDAQGEAGTPPFARLVADVHHAHHRVRLEVVVQIREGATSADAPVQRGRSHGTTQKLVRINRKAARALDLIGQLHVVLFTPADIILVDGPPGERRRYLDITLSQLNAQYVRTLAHYNRLIQQRNSLLRSWRERRRPVRAIEDEIGYWDQEVSAAGGYLLAERLRAVTELNTIAGPLFQEISGGGPPLEMHYRPSFDTDGANNAEELTRRLADALQSLRRDELHRGQTLIGPHRDDLIFTVNAINLGAYGSRGQQRSVALALKLGEARLMHRRSGDAPVLLLDDLLSELDARHRTHLLHTIQQPEQQTLLTATDLSNFDAAFLQHISCLRVDEGHVYSV